MIQKIKNYLGEARQELKHVNWPTKEEAFRLAAVVVLLSAFLALFLGGFDTLFAYVLQKFILKI